MKPAPEMTLDEETWERAQGGGSSAAAQADGNGTDADIEIAKLAKLTAVKYERKRKDAAKRLNMRASVLDGLVAVGRSKAKSASDEIFPSIDSLDMEVDGNALLGAIETRLRKHVAADDTIFTAATLWIAFAWTHDAFVHSTMLLATSKEPDSGKTTLLGVLRFLVPRGLATTEISAAALYRTIEKWHPTLLVDEADVIFRENEELRSVFNSGWTRGSGIIRCNPETHDPELFATFGPKVIGMKGLRLPDTTLGRCIVLEMKRKRRSEQITDFLHIDDAELAMLRSQLARWSTNHLDQVGKVQPSLLDGFENRLRANWWPLFCVAEFCGGEWPKKVRAAAQMLGRHDATSLYIQALTAIKEIFGTQTEMFSKDIVEAMMAIEDGPWKFYGGKERDKPITQNGLARLLKPIAPDTIRIGEGVAKGYYRHQFEDAFERYLGVADSEPKQAASPVTPPNQPYNRNKCDEIRTSGASPTVTRKSGVTVGKCEKPNNDGICYGVTVGKGGKGQNADLGTESGLGQRRIRELADWYEDQGYQRYCEGKLDTAELDADLRLILREEVAFPEHVEIEFERVMQLVFEV
jgi:putative DNA primase/helicase